MNRFIHRGGRVIGETDDDFEGKPVDLATGEIYGGGIGLSPGHLGATLADLAGLDHNEFLPWVEPISTAIGEG